MGKTTFTYGRRRRDLGLVGCLALLLFSAQPVASQSRPLVRQWDEALGYYNPAALAPLGTGQIAGLWGREDHRHSYYLLLTDLPLELLGGRHVVGAQLLHHQQDLWEHSTFSLRGSACLPLSEGKRLQLGVEGALHRLTFDGKKALEEGITNSELPTTKSEGKALGLSLGLQYYGERLSAGIAVTDLFGVHTRIGEHYTAQLPPRYSATLSYHIGSDVVWAFVPAIWGSYSQDEARYGTTLALPSVAHIAKAKLLVFTPTFASESYPSAIKSSVPPDQVAFTTSYSSAIHSLMGGLSTQSPDTRVFGCSEK